MPTCRDICHDGCRPTERRKERDFLAPVYCEIYAASDYRISQLLLVINVTGFGSFGWLVVCIFSAAAAAAAVCFVVVVAGAFNCGVNKLCQGKIETKTPKGRNALYYVFRVSYSKQQ